MHRNEIEKCKLNIDYVNRVLLPKIPSPHTRLTPPPNLALDNPVFLTIQTSKLCAPATKKCYLECIELKTL